MPSKEDSDETFRKKVTQIAEDTAMTAIERHTAECQSMHARSQETIASMSEAQDQMKTAFFGAFPPDAAKPGAWNIIQDLVGWRAGVNKVLWIIATGVIGGFVCTMLMIIKSVGDQ